MPQTRNCQDVETLKLTLNDPVNEVTVTLFFSIYKNSPVIVRKNRIQNDGNDALFIENAASCVLNLPEGDFDLIHLAGAWLKERQVKRHSLLQGQVTVESLYGASGHHQNPFVALAQKDATLTKGEVYGCNLVYSGNFRMQTDVNEWGMIRLNAGIHPHQFEWKLSKGEFFTTPEAFFSYSKEGLDGLSREYAEFIGDHIISPNWRYKERPIVVNSWEAYTFDFDSEKLLKLAKKGKEIGAECFVVDDGWFGKRNCDRSSLGDWFPDKEKFPNGLQPFAEKIHQMGLKLGIWFEPEMINEDAKLYQQHPE